MALQGYIKHIDPHMIFLSDDFEKIKCLPGAPTLFKDIDLGITKNNFGQVVYADEMIQYLTPEMIKQDPSDPNINDA